jgi:hypothetical protein
MRGLDPRIHQKELYLSKRWIAGSSPGNDLGESMSTTAGVTSKPLRSCGQVGAAIVPTKCIRTANRGPAWGREMPTPPAHDSGDMTRVLLRACGADQAR